jgi:cytochrome P450
VNCPVAEEFDRTVAQGADPYPCYARARAEQPIFYSARYKMWFVSRYDDVVRVLRDPRTFSSEGGSVKPTSWPEPVATVMAQRRHARHLGNTDPPAHSRLRQLLNPSFSPAGVARYEPLIRSTAAELTASLDASPTDIIANFCYPLPLIVMLQILGVPKADLRACLHWCQLKASLDFASETLSTAEQLDAARASVEFIGYCDELVEQRRSHPADDLITRLLHTEVRGYHALTDREVADLLPLLIFAGHETTANLMANLLHRLLRTDTTDRIRDDPALLDATIEENLRFDPPALGFVRRVTRDTEIAGTALPAGARVFLLFGSANHDETRWAAAETFDPDRADPGTHVAFGHGVHYCVGAPLARLEAAIGIQHLLAGLPGLRLAEPTAEPVRRPHLILRTMHGLTVSW